jgi:hypothetical protein
MSLIKNIYYEVKHFVETKRILVDFIGIPFVLMAIYLSLFFLRNYYDIFTPAVSGGFYIGLLYGLLKAMFCSLSSFMFIYFAFRKTLWTFFWQKRGVEETTAFQDAFEQAAENPKALCRVILFFVVYFVMFFALYLAKI